MPNRPALPLILLALLALLGATTANAAPADDALAALRELRILNYRVQTSAHVLPVSGNGNAARETLQRDIGRAESLLDQLDGTSRRGNLRLPMGDVRRAWGQLRNTAVLAMGVPQLPAREPADTNAPAGRAAWRDDMKLAGQRLAEALMRAMTAIPGPDEPASNIDFALAALELQYLAYRYTDIAGTDPAKDASGEPALLLLRDAFERRLRDLRQGYAATPQAPVVERLDTHWRFLRPALGRAERAPVPLLFARYVTDATDAMIPAFGGGR